MLHLSALNMILVPTFWFALRLQVQAKTLHCSSDASIKQSALILLLKKCSLINLICSVIISLYTFVGLLIAYSCVCPERASRVCGCIVAV